MKTWKQILDAGQELTEEQARAIQGFLGAYCSLETTRRLYWAIRQVSQPVGMLGRVRIKEMDGVTFCEYVAGQDYTSERRYIREQVLAGKWR